MRIMDFFNKYYESSLDLKEKFKITEEKEWNSLTVLNELQVQIGHVSYLISNNKMYGERNRKIDNIGDELSDVLLQVFSYSKKENIDLNHIEFDEHRTINQSVEKDLIDLLTIVGQLNEVTLEKMGYRHYKIRYGFPKVDDYIISLIKEFVSITFSIVDKAHIDIDYEYGKMLEDANGFLEKSKDNKSIEYYPIVDMHATWLVLNPIQGCPMSCKYCFLVEKRLNKTKPKVLISPEAAVDMLFNSPYYIDDIPLCLFSQTDAFSSAENIEYLKQLIILLTEKKIHNPIILISKCKIPQEIIDLVKKSETKGLKFIFFLSYSGLDKDIEVGVTKKNIQDNFIRLYQNGLTIVHYWRPFIKENSSKKKIHEVYDFVKKYSKASVIIGLKTTDMIIDKIEWEELSKYRKEALNSDSVWNKKAYDYIWGELKEHSSYPMYQATSCALAYVLKKGERKFFYNTDICKNRNLCPLSQRQICMEYEEIRKKMNIDDVSKLLKKLKLDINKDNIEIKDGVLYIHNTILKRTEISIITEVTGLRTIATSLDNDYYWNTSINSKDILKI